MSTFVSPDLPSGFPNHTASEIIAYVESDAEALESLTSKTRIRYQTPDKNGSVNLNIAFRKSDSLFASVRVTFGIEAARALITRDSFFVYDRVRKKLYHGEAKMIKAFIPTPAPLDELFPGMTGTMAPDRAEKWKVSSDSLYYHLVSVDGLRSYSIDPRIWKVVRMEVRGRGGEIVEERVFFDFDRFGLYVIPRRIEASRPGEGEKVSVYHRSVELNPDELSLNLKLGKISERILVRSRE